MKFEYVNPERIELIICEESLDRFRSKIGVPVFTNVDVSMDVSCKL